MGNVYYRLQEYPRALYFYLKAYRIQPEDEDLRNNLALVRVKAGVVAPHVGLQAHLISWLDRYSLNRFLIMGLVILTLGSLLVLNYLWGRKNEIWRNITVVAVLVFCAYSVVFAFKIYVHYAQKRAVVMVPGSEIKSGPAVGQSTIYVVPAGTEITILQTDQAWARVRFGAGLNGWINQKDFWGL